MKFLAPVALLLLVSTAPADEASKAAKIRDYFQAAKVDRLLEQIYNQVSNQTKSAAFAQMFGVNLPPEQQKMVDEMQDKVMQVVKDTLSWKELEPSYVKLYGDAFSESDIDAILAFYKSPAGQTMVSKTPQIMDQANKAVQERMMLMQPKIQELLREYMDRIKASTPEKK